VTDIPDLKPSSAKIPAEWGEKTTIAALVNQVVIVWEYVEMGQGQWGKRYFAVHVTHNDVHKWFFTGSEAVIRTLTNNQPPFRCKIIRVKSQSGSYYYNLAPPK